MSAHSSSNHPVSTPSQEHIRKLSIPQKMHFTKYFAIVAFIATGVLASPMPGKAPPPPPPKPAPPPPPSQPTTVSQSNTCGNNATPYCCNTDSKGAYTTCKVLGMVDWNDCAPETMLIHHRSWLRMLSYNSLLQCQQRKLRVSNVLKPY